MKGYDYSQEGLYFITICTQNRACLLGDITDGEMILNEYGKTVEGEWIRTAEIRKEIILHDFVVMPNHFHGIVEISWNTVGAYGIRPNEGIRPDNEGVNENNNGVDNMGECHSPIRRSPSKTIGALVRGFKSSVTKHIGFSIWQRNYYEHIIRNEQSYQNMVEYIITNPSNWDGDKLNAKRK